MFLINTQISYLITFFQ